MIKTIIDKCKILWIVLLCFHIQFLSAQDIYHNGFLYKTIKSPFTARIWLDRNIGADNMCTKSRENHIFKNSEDYIAVQENCFGYLYQWGRSTDGHQLVLTTNTQIKSKSTNIKASSYQNTGNNKFIATYRYGEDWLQDNVDTNGNLRMLEWSKMDLANICPIGFRAPTFEELAKETIHYNNPKNVIKVINRDTAFKNFLKLPVAGGRKDTLSYTNNQNIIKSTLTDRGEKGYIWSSTVHTNTPIALYYTKDSASHIIVSYSFGASIRCIQN